MFSKLDQQIILYGWSSTYIISASISVVEDKFFNDSF